VRDITERNCGESVPLPRPAVLEVGWGAGRPIRGLAVGEEGEMPGTALKQAPIAGVAVPIATLALVGVAIAARSRRQRAGNAARWSCISLSFGRRMRSQSDCGRDRRLRTVPGWCCQRASIAAAGAFDRSDDRGRIGAVSGSLGARLRCCPPRIGTWGVNGLLGRRFSNSGNARDLLITGLGNDVERCWNMAGPWAVGVLANWLGSCTLRFLGLRLLALCPEGEAA
jgi:hypothetical protein